MPPGWYALHVGAATSSHESQHALLASVAGMPSESELPHSAIVGGIRVSHSLSVEECASDPWAFGPVCNVIDATFRLERPVPAKGALSMWQLGAETRRQVEAQLEQVRARAPRCRHDAPHRPLASPVPQGSVVTTVNDVTHLPPNAPRGDRKRQRERSAT